MKWYHVHEGDVKGDEKNRASSKKWQLTKFKGGILGIFLYYAHVWMVLIRNLSICVEYLARHICG